MPQYVHKVTQRTAWPHAIMAAPDWPCACQAGGSVWTERKVEKPCPCEREDADFRSRSYSKSKDACAIRLIRTDRVSAILPVHRVRDMPVGRNVDMTIMFVRHTVSNYK